MNGSTITETRAPDSNRTHVHSASPTSAATGEHLAGTYDDVPASESAVSAAFHPHSLVIGSPRSKFRGILDAVRFGPFVMGEISYNVALELECPRVYGYHINVPTQGALRSMTTHGEIHTPPGWAVVYRKDHGATLSTVSGTVFQTFALKIDARAVENTVSAMLGIPCRGEALQFAEELDLRSGKGAQWWRLVSNVRDQWASNPLLHDPLVAEPLCQSVLAGLLLAARHQYSEQLHRTASAPAPPVIRLAEDLILDRLTEPVTTETIAREVGLSTRALQRGFVQHLGVTPSQYIRNRRLERVHSELATADPATTKVSTVASRWGFGHLGRFAHMYRMTYGVSPRETLLA